MIPALIWTALGCIAASGGLYMLHVLGKEDPGTRARTRRAEKAAEDAADMAYVDQLAAELARDDGPLMPLPPFPGDKPLMTECPPGVPFSVFEYGAYPAERTAASLTETPGDYLDGCEDDDDLDLPPLARQDTWQPSLDDTVAGLRPVAGLPAEVRDALGADSVEEALRQICGAS